MQLWNKTILRMHRKGRDMEGMVKVRLEYLREEAAALSKECEQALAQYQETVERFTALAMKFETKGMERLCVIAKEELEAAGRPFERTKWFAERLFQIAEYYEQAERGNVDAAGVD